MLQVRHTSHPNLEPSDPKFSQIFIYLFSTWGAEREWKSWSLLVHSPTSSLPAVALPTQDWSLKPGIQSRSTTWVTQESNNLSYHHCLPECALAKCWRQGSEPLIKPRCSEMEHGHLHCRPSAYHTSLNVDFFFCIYFSHLFKVYSFCFICFSCKSWLITKENGSMTGPMFYYL